MNVYEGETGYLNLLGDILVNGSSSDDRTGTGTQKVFGRMIRFDLNEGFPLLTTKKVWFKGILIELLWFISGSTNIRPLVMQGVHIWDEWPYQAYLERQQLSELIPKYTEKWILGLKDFIDRIKEDEEFALEFGDLGGQAYGKGWRNFNGVDQLGNAINTLKNNPYSRRIMVNAWNPPEIEQMPKGSLPPCHYGYQFFVSEGEISILVNIRSWDVFLGGPFNIASYALLLMMVAQVTGLQAKEVIISSGDTHIYNNHIEAVTTQIERVPYALPKVIMNPEVAEIDDFAFEDFKIIGYNCHPAIKAPISV